MLEHDCMLGKILQRESDHAILQIFLGQRVKDQSVLALNSLDFVIPGTYTFFVMETMLN